MGKVNPSSEANGNGAGKMFSADCVAVLLMATGNASISKTQYEMMSALDGNHTASSYQHQFRSVVAKARELKQRVDDGEKFVPVQPGAKKRGVGAAAGNFTPPPTPKKPKVKPEAMDDERTTPTHKPKATPKSKAGDRAQKEKTAANGLFDEDNTDNGNDSVDDMLDFIKEEQMWEKQFV